MACNRPWITKDKNGNLIPVPCGWCIQCRIDKRNEWSMRLQFEVAKHKGAFVTLTYNDINYPADGSLSKKHVQDFLKRLRKSIGKETKIKYYAVGEYGEKGNLITNIHRAHYHLIITGMSALNIQKHVRKAWQFGFVTIKGAEPANIRYTLKYMDKQIHGIDSNKEYGNKLPPFALMSKGIGKEWFYENQKDIEEIRGIRFNGKIRPLPRYFRDRLTDKSGFSISPDEKLKIKKYMDETGCTFIAAMNHFGIVKENQLVSKINVLNKF